jgi:neutral trehalase
MAWQACLNHGLTGHAVAMAGGFLELILRGFAGNSVIVEKYDAVSRSPRGPSEYPTVGYKIKRRPREGFAWTNSAIVLADQLLGSDVHSLRRNGKTRRKPVNA